MRRVCDAAFLKCSKVLLLHAVLRTPLFPDDVDVSAGNHYSVVNTQIASAKRFITPITKTMKPALDYAW